MLEYHVGPDVPYYGDDLNKEDFVWLITWYEDDGYSGSGIGASLLKDGRGPVLQSRPLFVLWPDG